MEEQLVLDTRSTGHTISWLRGNFGRRSLPMFDGACAQNIVTRAMCLSGTVLNSLVSHFLRRSNGICHLEWEPASGFEVVGGKKWESES
jgi:hypothetical protein